MRWRVITFGILILAIVAAACAGGGTAGGTSDVVVRIPFSDGERLVYGIHNDSGTVISRGTLTITEADGRLHLEQRYVEVGAPAGAELGSDVVEVVVDIETLKPIGGGREITVREGDDELRIERYEWIYSLDTAEPRLEISSTRDGEQDTDELRLREHVYENESSLWLWRTLDLVDDYQARYISVNALEGSQQTVELRVTQRQTIEVPAGEFDTWRMRVRTGRATRVVWINVESPHQVVQWDTGSLVFRLESYSGGGE